VEGLVGIHPVSYDEGLFVTRVLHRDNTGKGYGTIALKNAINDISYRKDITVIFSDVLPNNIAAQKSLGKVGFIADGNITINGKKYNRFFYKINTEETSDRLTYLTLFEDISDEIYDVNLSDWEKVSLDQALKSKYVDFIAAEGKYAWDKRLYNIRASLKYRIDAHLMTDKIDLHEILGSNKQTENFIAETYVVKPGTKTNIKDGDVWIWRPEGERGGKGVRVVSSQSELDSVRSAFEKAGPRFKRGIISRYIEDPMLLEDGRKFHLRIYFTAVVTEDTVTTFVYETGSIEAARKPFIKGDYCNADIHDSHHIKEESLFYPEDFPSREAVNDINKQILDILVQVTKIVGPTFRKYDEADVGYELFGCDFMIREDGTVVLIEINFKPGLRYSDEERKKYLHDILGTGIIDTIVCPHFYSSEPNYEYAKLVSEVKIK